jgi:hypothetical protein
MRGASGLKGAWLSVMHAASNVEAAAAILRDGAQDAGSVAVRQELIDLQARLSALAERMKMESADAAD